MWRIIELQNLSEYVARILKLAFNKDAAAENARRKEGKKGVLQNTDFKKYFIGCGRNQNQHKKSDSKERLRRAQVKQSMSSHELPIMRRDEHH